MPSTAGAVFAVDATQALGRIPVSLEGVDYLVASSYKWLTRNSRPRGSSILRPASRDRLRPRAVGWYSVEHDATEERFREFRFKPGAARLATGMPNFPAMYALKEGLELLNTIGIERLEAGLGPLVRQLREGFERIGVPLLTSGGSRAHIRNRLVYASAGRDRPRGSRAGRHCGVGRRRADSRVGSPL